MFTGGKELKALSKENVLVVIMLDLCFKFADANMSGLTRMKKLVYNFLATLLACQEGSRGVLAMSSVGSV